MPRFILLLHENPAEYRTKSPAETQATIADYRAWSEKLGAAGKLAGGDKLTDDGGRHIRAKENRPIVTDGPYAEAKELIGGFFCVTAADYDEAVKIANECPHLSNAPSNWIEVRQVEWS